MTSKITAALVLVTALFTLGACANTVRGVGADVSNTVDAGEAAANDIAY
ncbi:hypothetical protein [Fulvimarina sp. MAC8]